LFEEASGYAKHARPGELYNLRDDLGQKKNRYAEMPEKVAELKERLQAIRVQGQVR